MIQRFLALLVLVSVSGMAGAQWAYRNIGDEMRGTVAKRATVTSLNSQPTREGPARMQIMAWDDPKMTSAAQRYIGLEINRGMINCNVTGLCEFHVKADDDDVVGMHGELQDGYAVLWLTEGSSAQLFELFNRAKRLTIEVPIYRSAPAQFKFTVGPIRWAP